MTTKITSAFAVAFALTAMTACSVGAEPKTVRDCLDMAVDRKERSQIKYQMRYSNFEAYQGVELYTLYRSELGGNGKSRLATFDSLDGKQYTPDFNKAACELAAASMQENDAYGRSYGCELSAATLEGD